MITLIATSTPNFYDVLSSNQWDHYPLIVKEDNSIECGCKGFTYHGHCYHVLEAAQMVTFIHEPTTTAIPVEGTDAREVTCPFCGAWMMAWAFPKHLAGNFCTMYLEAAPAAAPAPAPAISSVVYDYPLAA